MTGESIVDEMAQMMRCAEGIHRFRTPIEWYSECVVCGGYWIVDNETLVNEHG